LPNVNEIRQNLADTTSAADEELTDTLFGYHITEHLSIRLKARWGRFEDFRDSGIVWEPL